MSHSRFLAPLASALLLAPPLLAAPAKPALKSASSLAPSLSGWSYANAEDLESSWAWRALIKGARGEARIAFGALDKKSDAFLRVQSNGSKVTFQFWKLRNGRPEAASEVASVALKNGRLDGELGLQATDTSIRALWNGSAVVQAWGLPSTEGSLASAAKGFSLGGARLQPTEEVVFSDDFMRASAPGEPELPGSWQRVAGVWKTSGLLGVQADAARNPNPFVFRAEASPSTSELKTSGEQQVLARVGSWFWSDYAITASVKPIVRDASAPLLVGLGAYMGDREHARTGVSALVDARSGRAMIVRGTQVLARSAPFDFEANNWHRLYFEPGPGTLRFFVDGVERIRLDTSSLASSTSGASSTGDASQGSAALVARLSGANFADFDDVRASHLSAQSDDFRRSSPGRWADARGAWQAVAGARVLKSSEGLTLTGTPEREEGSVEAMFRVAKSSAPSTSGASGTSVGAAFAAVDGDNYFVARVRGSKLEIVQVQNAKARLLGSAPLLTSTKSERVGVSVQWRDGIISARSRGAVATASIAAIPAGRVGAWAKQGAGNVSLLSLRALGAAPSWGEGALPERFEKDFLMKNWASNAAAWKRGADGFSWHTGDFFGDAALSLPVPTMASGSRIVLRLAADPAKDASGARLEIARLEKSWKWTLSQGGKYLQSGTLSEAQWPTVASSEAEAKPTRSIRFVRRPLGDGRASLRAVADGRVLFTTEASAPREADAIKCGVAFVPPGSGSEGPRGREITARMVTVERDKRAIVGVKLEEVSEETRRDLALGEGKGAVVLEIEGGTPAEAAGLKIGDVIRAVDGKRVQNIDEVIAVIGAKTVGQAIALTVWRQGGYGALDWDRIAATTSQSLDYTFTGAPVDWKPVAGKWEVAERWTCSPQWAFFNGSNASTPALWSRFEAHGDWTLEAYLATAMDQTRGERSPMNLNLTIDGDGRDLSSGYSWIFAGGRDKGFNDRAFNRVYKGDAVALEKPFEMPALRGDTHRDWFYVRLEKRRTANGLRFRYFVNNKMLMEYADPTPLKAALEGGHFAFWSYNSALSIARARLWYSGVKTPNVSSSKSQAPAVVAASTSSVSKPIPNALGAWSARREDALRSTALVSSQRESGRAAVKITNAQSGGDWTAYVSRKPFDAAQKPILSFDYRVAENVKVNLYAKVDNRWREIVFTGEDAAASKPVAAVGAPGMPTPQMVGANGVDTSIRIGTFANVVADNKWHRASIDLSSALRAANVGSMMVQEIAFAAPDRDYLRAGLGGNHLGATYWIANLDAGKAGGAPATIAQAPRE